MDQQDPDVNLAEDRASIAAGEPRAMARTGRSSTQWFQSLQFRIAVGLALTLIVMIAAVVVANQTLGRSTLIEKNFDILVQAGNRLVTELGQQIDSAEALTRSLANLGERLPYREELYRKIVPHLMDYEGQEDIIAGGGIWPEPNVFQRGRERRSFFWGREANGKLKYYDDYNDPHGKGYHHEEWYVPAKYFGNDRCFWSKSYMDPYSFEPMVTCTVPMRADDKSLLGVATIDVRLNGLQQFFATRVREIGGYAFAVDRNNKLLSFPNTMLAKIYTTTAEGRVSEDFITTDQLANAHAEFRPIAQLLDSLSAEVQQRARANPKYDVALVKRITAESYQINETEAETIVSMLQDPLTTSTPPMAKAHRFSVADDLLLHEPVLISVFLMPKTYWKIVIVTPQRIATASANHVTERIVMILTAVLLISMVGTLLWLRHTLVRPLRGMTQLLKTSDHAESALTVILNDAAQNEIGELAFYFNQRSEALKKFNEALKESEKKFRSVAETAKDAIVVSDAAGMIVSCNEATQEMFGYGDENLVGQPITLLIPGWQGRTSATEYERHHQINWTPPLHNHFEIQGRKHDNTQFPIEVSVSEWETSTGKFHGSFIRDITTRKRYEQQIQHMASHDVLTKLPNRMLFQDRLTLNISQAKRNNTKLALLFLDLDNFKEINDTLGHDAGDRLLRKVAARLVHQQRESDTVARLGGDEFALILPDVKDVFAVTEVAKRAIAKISRKFKVDRNDVYIGVSIGITIFPDDDVRPQQLIKNADIAMYQAKANGRNTFCFFNTEMNVELQHRKEIVGELRWARERQELHLQYQPLVDTGSGEIVGIEALLRWQRPGHGMVPPGQFIPIAEQSGLIVGMEEWTFETVCAQLAAWIAAGRKPVPISVNISSVHFLQPNFALNLEATLVKHAVPPHLIELEITESLLVQDVEMATETMVRLRGIGIRLAIDDFGTGYSSLSYLRQFPVDTLKIDRSFVKDLGESTNSIAIVKAIAVLSHSLGMRVVAEGVETAQQALHVREAGCDVIQGFHFFRPLNMEDLVVRLYGMN